MQIYFTPSQIPELTSLSPSQRRLILQRCIIRKDVATRVIVVICLSTFFTLISQHIIPGFVGYMISGSLAASIGIYSTTIVQFTKRRGDIRRFIADHAEEIEAAR